MPRRGRAVIGQRGRGMNGVTARRGGGGAAAATHPHPRLLGPRPGRGRLTVPAPREGRSGPSGRALLLGPRVVGGGPARGSESPEVMATRSGDQEPGRVSAPRVLSPVLRGGSVRWPGSLADIRGLCTEGSDFECVFVGSSIAASSCPPRIACTL
jgi:hypothetical protein